jgi:hypothetical protein
VTSLEQPDIFGSYLALRVRPIMHPSETPPAVTDILVGLNPRRADGILTQAGLLERPGLRFSLP